MQASFEPRSRDHSGFERVDEDVREILSQGTCVGNKAEVLFGSRVFEVGIFGDMPLLMALAF